MNNSQSHRRWFDSPSVTGGSADCEASTLLPDAHSGATSSALPDGGAGAFL